MTHDDRCIDRSTYECMIEACDRVIAEQAKEIAMLRARDGALETADQWIADGARREKELQAEIEQLRAALLPFGVAASRPGALVYTYGDTTMELAAPSLPVPFEAWKRAAELTGA